MIARAISFAFVLLPSFPVLAGVAASSWTLDNPTPLMLACQKGEIATVEKLITKGANVGETNRGSATPLIFAASQGQLAVIRKLLSAGANPNQCAWESMYPLWYAINYGSYDAAKLLIDAGAKASVNPGINALEHPTLHHAAASGRTDLVLLLLDHGAEVDYSAYFGGNTALAMAVRVGNANTAKLLLERGANLGWVTEVPYYEGKTALEIARMEGHTATVALVLNALKDKKYNQPKYSVSRVIDRLFRDPSYNLSAEGQDLVAFLRRQTQEDLRIIRNTIFARKNFKFQDQKLIEYFTKRFQSYRPSTTEIQMSATDKLNVDYMNKVEDYARGRDAAG